MKALLPQRFCWIGGIVTVALLLCSGCAHQKPPAPPLTPPALVSGVVHYADHRARAATGPATAISTANALAVSIEWLAVEQMPADGVPLATETRVLASAGGSDPLLILPKLTRGTRIVQGADLDALLSRLHSPGNPQVVSLGSASGALPSGVTATFSLAPTDINRKTGRAIEIKVHRPATQPVADISFIVEAPLQPAPPQRERAILDPIPLAAPLKVALIVPFAFESSPAKSVVAILTVEHGEGDDFQKALAQCQKDLSNPNIASTQPATQPALPSPALAAGIEWLQGPQDARRALLFLADQTHAPLAADVALVADDATIARLRAKLLSRLTSGGPIEERQVGWTLESVCFADLASLQATENLPPELASCLTRFAGEAGRHDSSLEELMKNAHSQEELAARTIAENYIYLEDNSPSARVRAFDWLTVQGHAPAGYDPLAPLKERRAALDRATTAAAGGRS